MRCPSHILREAVGYCHVCGAFGCGDCLHFHEGQYYCKRDYKPIQDKLERQRKHEELRHRPERQRLVVHTKKGDIYFGVCFAMNLAHDGFKLDVMDAHGEPTGKNQGFLFRDIKAVFYVKSFDGPHGQGLAPVEQKADGGGIVVAFTDGEVIKGHTYQAYHSDSPRFHLIPDDLEGNNLSVLVERSALTATYTPEEYHELKKKEMKDFIRAHMEPGKDTEELIGDYYVSKKDARRAVKHYYKALETTGQSPALLKKIVASEYNTAMQYMREKHLTHALQHLEKAKKYDEGNEAVSNKIAQIRHALRLDRSEGRASAG